MRVLALILLLAAGAAQAADAPFLWEVQGPKTRHYLLGSVHVLPQSAYPLPAALDAAYNAAETVVFESDLGALSDPKIQMHMLADAQAPEGGIKGRIGNELYARLQAYATAHQLPPEVCDSFKPWFCALTLEILSFEHRDPGIDQHYYQRAKAAQKAILWFEEPAAQLKLFTGMSEATSQQLLVSTLDETGSDGATMEQIVGIWQANDTAGMEKIDVQFKAQQPQLYERLLAMRNRAWMPRLTRLLDGASTNLIIVGAAHLVGPDGLVAQLKARGYAVQPVVPVALPAAPAPAAASEAPAPPPKNPLAPTPANTVPVISVAAPAAP